MCFYTCCAGVLPTADGDSDEALRKLFMRIDANCDATIDWDEFSGYLLLERGGAGPGTSAGVEPGFSETNYTLERQPVEVLAAGAAHKELISSVVHVTAASGADRWFSTGRDGTVRVWAGKVRLNYQTPWYQGGYMSKVVSVLL
jgi:hypothetical protein